jgi:alpha-L-rhamnosidase
VPRPRFSWMLVHPERGRSQSAYQILVASDLRYLEEDKGDLWDSGNTRSNLSVNIEYRGRELESRKRYYWKVRWWDDLDRVSLWSRPAMFEMGLLRPEDWKARWITGGALLRRKFMLTKKVLSARIYVTGLGYYELRINGTRVGDRLLDPAWTDYDKLVLYSAYDVSSLLREGENVVGVMLGNGRFNVKTERRGNQKHWGEPRALAQLHVDYADGSSEVIVTDESWRAADGPIVDNDIYDGEVYDARLEKDGWDSPSYDDASWLNAKTADPPKGRLSSQATLPPIRAVRFLAPHRLLNPRPGVYIFDFGQNFSGWVRLSVSGPRGAEVRLRYSELLNPDGTLNVSNLRSAKATDVYILKGDGLEVYEPRFTYHGFRYVEVTGFPGVPSTENLQGIVAHTDVESAGGFSCSHSLINEIHRVTRWSQLSNLMSIPTDCPQRDERMGWLGDAQLTAEEAIHNFNMAALYTKWVRDLRLAQREDGAVPDVVPPYWILYPADPAWGQACIMLPWLMYLYYADKRILEENYGLMKGWVEYLTSIAEQHILRFSKYGDWCPPGQVKSLATPGEVVSTLCYYESTLLLSKIAQILGRNVDAAKYAELAEKIKEAFNKAYLKEDCYAPLEGVFSQTANCIPLFLDIVPPDKREGVLRRLINDLVISRDYHVNTGIVGTRYLLEALANHGQADTAFRLVSQTTYPSWGYMIREGATTLWERWEHLSGSGMNSHNHVMLGSIDSWFYKALAGINADPDHPGFEKVVIKPHLVDGLEWVDASLATMRGIITSRWEKRRGLLTLKVTIPVNSRGEIYLPTLGVKKPVIEEGGIVVWRDDHYVEGCPGIESGRREGEYVVLSIGSGSYTFSIKDYSETSRY